MDSFANNPAHTLIAHGMKRGDFIGLYMDKSVEMFISILATHKAGGTYVPPDPENPPDRTRIILGVADSKIVLTSNDLQHQHQLNNTLLRIDITSLVVDVHKLSPSNKPDVGPTIGRDDVCHVLFTSGSTGTPKGV
jgi:non-ribosomal peptide synthetase component F